MMYGTVVGPGMPWLLFRKVVKMKMPTICLFHIAFLPALVLAEVDIIERVTVVGSNVTLSCPNPTGNVSWIIEGSIDLPITTCSADGTCTAIAPYVRLFANYIASSNQTTSNLTVRVTSNTVQWPSYKCVSGEDVLKLYQLVFITREDIHPPKCNLSFVSSLSEIVFTCESAALGGTTQSLTIRHVFVKTVLESQTHIEKVITINEFINTTDASCLLDFTELGETRECTFPSPAVIHQKNDGTDIEFECDFDEDVLDDESKIEWRLLDSDNEEVDISGRAWIRDGGRQLLLLEITEDDDGKVVECKVYREENPSDVISLGFGIITFSKAPDDPTDTVTLVTSGNSGSTSVPMTSVNASNAFMILSFVFAVLWILTITLPVVWYKCTKRKTKEDNSAPAYSTVIYKDSRTQAPFQAGNSAADTKDATYYYHTIKGGAVDLDEDGYLVLTGDMGGGVLGDDREAGGSKKCQGRDVDEDEDGYLVVLQDSRDGNGGNGGREAQGEVKCNEYMEMSGSKGQVEYEWMKSLTYENCAK